MIIIVFSSSSSFFISIFCILLLHSSKILFPCNRFPSPAEKPQDPSHHQPRTPSKPPSLKSKNPHHHQRFGLYKPSCNTALFRESTITPLFRESNIQFGFMLLLRSGFLHLRSRFMEKTVDRSRSSSHLEVSGSRNCRSKSDFARTQIMGRDFWWKKK